MSQILNREEVIAAYRDILNRQPESAAAIDAHLGHASVEALRRSLLGSEEYANLSANLKNRRGLADLIAEIDSQPNTGDVFKDMMPFVQLWADVPPCSFNPDSQQYREWVLGTYKSISGCDYETIRETGFVTDEMVNSPFPYNTRNPHIVGEQLMAIGYVIQAMNLPVPSSVLEVGFGWGNTLLQMARMGYHVSGLDIEPKYTELVNRQAGMLGLTVDAKQGEFFDLEGMGAKFDAILFFEAFHHCDDPIRLLKAIPDRLNESGKLILAGEAITDTLPYPWGVNTGGQAIYCIRKFGWLELCFREDYLLGLLDRMGWNVVKHAFPLSATGITYVATRR